MQQLIEMRHETPEGEARKAVLRELQAGRACIVAYSAGKDSSCLANLVVTAAAEVVAEGRSARVVITHCETGIENPEVTALAEREMRKIAAYCAAKGVQLDMRVARPAFWETFAVRVIGGRALPTFPDSRRDCTSSWKREPAQRAIKEIFEGFPLTGEGTPILMTGVRRDESIARGQSIAQRRETSVQLWTDADGRLRLSPLLEWTTDDVWTYLGLCNAGVIESYSDFSETMELYQAAGGSSCVIVADAEMEKHSKPCSSRFGCHLCTAVREDKSLHQMIDGDSARYGYMRPLAALRDFIAYTQYDWSRRQFVGRSIVDGTIAIGADTYSPDMLAELLRYALTAQVDSGVPLVSMAQLIAIDARWSQYAIAPPFSALRIWRDVERGKRWYPPRVAAMAKTPVPRLGLIHVGDDWNDDVKSRLSVTGLREPMWELFSETCGPGQRVLRNGRAVVDVEGDSEVDEEAAWLFMDFEADRMIDERSSRDQDWTAGYMTYVSMGLIRPAKGGSRKVDEILRRSQWRQRHGLHGQQDIGELKKRLTVRFPEQADLFEGCSEGACQSA